MKYRSVGFRSSQLATISSSIIKPAIRWRSLGDSHARGSEDQKQPVQVGEGSLLGAFESVFDGVAHTFVQFTESSLWQRVVLCRWSSGLPHR